MVIFGWMEMTWYMRTATYREKAREYVMAARALGASTPRILFQHILPNSISIIVTFIPFSVAAGRDGADGARLISASACCRRRRASELLAQGTANLQYPWIVTSVRRGYDRGAVNGGLRRRSHPRSVRSGTPRTMSGAATVERVMKNACRTRIRAAASRAAGSPRRRAGDAPSKAPSDASGEVSCPATRTSSPTRRPTKACRCRKVLPGSRTRTIPSSHRRTRNAAARCTATWKGFPLTLRLIGPDSNSDDFLYHKRANSTRCAASRRWSICTRTR